MQSGSIAQGLAKVLQRRDESRQIIEDGECFACVVNMGHPIYTIMPAATVSFVWGSMRMKEPVFRLRR
jgi:hypothetical protein